MKGHPGYFGDHVQHCVDMIKAVGSPRMKLLFDIYHVQIMDGDVIRHIRQYKDVTGHYHTASVPGGATRRDAGAELSRHRPGHRGDRLQGFMAQEFIRRSPIA
jgi:hydroxypyruvate isomerase